MASEHQVDAQDPREDGSGDEVWVGDSSIHLEPPDVIVWSLVGDIIPSTMFAFGSAQQRFATGKPFVFVLIDVSRAGRASPEARQAAAKAGGETKVRATAYFGASFHLRVLATLISKASQLMKPHRKHPVRFFATEAEARAWLAEQREVLVEKKRD